MDKGGLVTINAEALVVCEIAQISATKSFASYSCGGLAKTGKEWGSQQTFQDRMRSQPECHSFVNLLSQQRLSY